MSKRNIYCQSNGKGGMTLSLDPKFSEANEKNEQSPLSLGMLSTQLSSDGPCFNDKDKLVRDTWLAIERLVKQEAGYAEVTEVVFHLSGDDGSPSEKILPKEKLNKHFKALHQRMSRPSKGLAIASASFLVLGLTAMGLSQLSSIGSAGFYAGLGFLAVAIVLVVEALIAHAKAVPVQTYEQRQSSMKSLAQMLGIAAGSTPREPAKDGTTAEHF